MRIFLAKRSPLMITETSDAKHVSVGIQPRPRFGPHEDSHLQVRDRECSCHIFKCLMPGSRVLEGVGRGSSPNNDTIAAPTAPLPTTSAPSIGNVGAANTPAKRLKTGEQRLDIHASEQPPVPQVPAPVFSPAPQLRFQAQPAP